MIGDACRSNSNNLFERKCSENRMGINLAENILYILGEVMIEVVFTGSIVISVQKQFFIEGWLKSPLAHDGM